MKRVYDTNESARAMRERFADRPVEYETNLDFNWPKRVYHVGDSLAVAYSSDKWKPRRGDMEDYKHLAESPNRAYVVRQDLFDEDMHVQGVPVNIGHVPMPGHVAIIGLFLEANLRLFDDTLMPSNDRVFAVSTKHAMLGGGVIPWKKTGKRKKDQPFLFVYSEPRGSERGAVHMLIFGDSLGIEKDGIVG